jgi:transposase
MTRLYGRAPIGERLVASVPHGHWKTTTFVAGLGLAGIVAPAVFDKPMDGPSFLAYVEQAVAPCLRPGDVVLMDNLPAHKVAGVENAIRSAGASLLFTPPYSPDFNPIEKFYAHVGAALIAAHDGKQDAFNAIVTVIPWERFRTTVAEAEALTRPDEFDAYQMLGEHYAGVRRWAPAFLEAFAFQSVPAAAALMRAIEALRGMNRMTTPSLPKSAPTSFVRQRWARHVLSPGGVIDRRYYELCVLSELRDRLRAGDVWVTHPFIHCGVIGLRQLGTSTTNSSPPCWMQPTVSSPARSIPCTATTGQRLLTCAAPLSL